MQRHQSWCQGLRLAGGGAACGAPRPLRAGAAALFLHAAAWSLVAGGALKERLEDGRYLRPECQRDDEEYPPSLQPGDLDQRFRSVTHDGAWAELSPKVLSTDPWIVYFETFMTDEEVALYDELTSSWEFKNSTIFTDGVPSVSQARTSTTANCIGNCTENAVYQTMLDRGAAVTGVPKANFENTQATRYAAGGYFTQHHDNDEGIRKSPSGSRIFTIFVYLQEADEGGETHFPEIDIKVPSKRGAAIWFPNVLSEDPEKQETRTKHASLPVTRGLKRGLNFWIHQHNFVEFASRDCVNFEDCYAAEGEITKKTKIPVVFRNTMREAMDIFWVDPAQYDEQKVNSVAARGEASISSFWKHKFRIRSAAGGRAVMEYVVKATTSTQFVDITGWSGGWTPPPSPPPSQPKVTFVSHVRVPVSVFWLAPSGEEKLISAIEGFGTGNINSFAGHTLRLRVGGGEVVAAGEMLLEYVVESRAVQEVDVWARKDEL